MEKITELDINRIQALTDAIFAVVSTLLILNLQVPSNLSHTGLVYFLFNEVAYKLLIFFLSFIIIAAFWIDSHYHHHLIVKINLVTIWLNLLFLMFICLIPFSSSLLANYRQDWIGIIIYSSNLICASICHLAMLQYSWRKQFIIPHITSVLYANMKLRIVLPIVVYIIIIPLSFYFSKWIVFLFLIPLCFQIIFGRSKKETIA